MMFNGTITPWLVGALLFLVILTTILTARAWRESKRSPYFFLRQQAQKQMQSYSVASLGLTLATVLTAVYGWQAPNAQAAPRFALIDNTKPGLEISAIEPVEEASPQTLIYDQPIPNNVQSIDMVNASETTEIVLPAEFNQISPSAELKESTQLGAIAFSTTINDEYEAVSANRTFVEGNFTLYATFSYEGMEDGMEWAWAWFYNGEVISGGNERWAYGDEGPGYIYLNPEEGFRAGEYMLVVWVNEAIQTRANVLIANNVTAR